LPLAIHDAARAKIWGPLGVWPGHRFQSALSTAERMAHALRVGLAKILRE
jgi:hypothetical protein